jgi:hypothetical protein
MVIKSFDNMMGKFINIEDERLNEVVQLIGSKTSLREGLNLAKALINNYFVEDDRAEAILKLIKEAEEKKC